MMTEPRFEPQPGWASLRDVPGWQPLYERLQASVAELDPAAQVTVVQRPHRLHLHVVDANPAVLQPIKDLCFDAEGAAILACQICGGPGEVRNLGQDQSRWRVRCDAHAEPARPLRYSTGEETKAKRAAVNAGQVETDE